MRQIIAHQEVTPQVSGPPVGTRRWLANPLLSACRAAGPGERVPVVPLSGADEAVSGRADEPHSGPSGGAARTDWPTHFQITSSEIANTCSQHRKRQLSIHLHASYSNVISCCR